MKTKRHNTTRVVLQKNVTEKENSNSGSKKASAYLLNIKFLAQSVEQNF